MEEEKSEIELSDCIEDFVQAVWFFVLNGKLFWDLNTYTYIFL